MNNKFALALVLGGALVIGARIYMRHATEAHSPIKELVSEAEAGRKLLDSRESLYDNIYIYKVKDYLMMTFGYNRRFYIESLYNPRDELELPAPYMRDMTVGLAYARQVKSILSIGFGGGRTDWYLHRSLPNVEITSVELDPAVVEMARKYFGIKDEPNFHLVTQDGRMFLASSKDRYDIILIDAYRGPFVPFHLLTKEFYQLVRDHLSEGGVVVQNIDVSTMLFDSAARTIGTVFPVMDFYPADDNVVMVAYDGKAQTPEDLMHRAEERQNEFHLRYDLRGFLHDRRHVMENGGTVDPQAKILTDDFAPVEFLKAVERHNRKWPDQPPKK